MDIFDEAKESLKEERIQEFLNKNYKKMISIVAVFITALSLGVWWNQYSKETIYKDGGEYMMAVLKMRSYSPEEAISKFDKIKDNKTVYSTMADLNIAAYNSFKNNNTAALESYKNITNSRSTPKPLNDLARLLEIKTALSLKGADQQAAISQLKDYIDSKPIFKASAQELLLAIYLEQNDLKNAKELFHTLVTDINVPRIIRERVSQMEILINL